MFAIFNNITSLVYDARQMWNTIHFNRNIMRRQGTYATILDNGVAPSEGNSSHVFLGETWPELYLGFDYLHFVLKNI